MADPPQERVYVALGSNLDGREEHLRRAVQDIARLDGVSGLVCSSLYETAPMGPQDQPDYLNAVCRFDYSGTARALMGQLQAVEREHGRQAGGRRWGERPLDLDIALFGEQIISEPDLIVPHAGLAERSFVLWPLAELDEALVVPGKAGEAVAIRELQKHCQRFGIQRLAGGPLGHE